LVVLATSAVLCCAIQAPGSDLASIEIDGVEVHLGMTRPELAAALPDHLELGDATDLVPVGAQYLQQHGEKSFIARVDRPRSAVAWLTFENGPLTQVLRVIENLEGGTAHEMSRALASGIRSAFGDGEIPLIVSSGSYPVDGRTFDYLEARAGAKRVIVRSLPGFTQVCEELGRRDIAVAE